MEPGTEQVIEAKLENGYDRNTGTPGILEESRELRGKSEISIARSLVIPRDGLTIVRVATFSDRPIRLRSDFPVADPDPDFTSTSHASCSVIDRPVVKDEQPMRRKSGNQFYKVTWKGCQKIREGNFRL